MDYYYTDASNQTRGPVSEAELQALATSGQVTPATMVAAVGSQQWVSIATVLPTFPGAPAPGMPAMAAPGAPFPAAAPTEPLAIWSLVTSIVGIVCGCMFLGSLAGIITGHMALSSIKKNPALGGRSMAMAGLIIGYLGIVGWTLYFILVGGMALIQGMNGH